MDEQAKKPSYTIHFVVTLAAILASALVIAGLFWALSWRHYVWTNNANIEAYGSDLGANVTERVTGIFADEGDLVKQGDLLVLLENNVPLAEKAKAEAEIQSIEQQIKVRQAQYEKVRNDYIRAEEGIADEVISAQEFDHREKDYQMADAELKLAYANLDLAKRRLEAVEAKLTHYAIYAPGNGIVSKRWIWFGDVTSPGQSLLTVFDLDNIWVLARVEEEKIESVRMGAEVSITVDAYPGWLFKGRVFSINGAAASNFSLVPQNNATGNFTKVAQRIPIKISIERPDDFPEDKPLYLFPGMQVEVWIKKA